MLSIIISHTLQDIYVICSYNYPHNACHKMFQLKTFFIIYLHNAKHMPLLQQHVIHP